MGDVEVNALRNVRLDLYPGEFVMLLGPSGSGKSTLLNILGGLDVPTSGQVFYLDHDLTAASEYELTRYRPKLRPEPLLWGSAVSWQQDLAAAPNFVYGFTMAGRLSSPTVNDRNRPL